MAAPRRRASGEIVLGRALQGALGRWEALARYAGNGHLAIDNTAAERLLRDVALSRKNVLPAGSDKGGERAAILYALIETAKLSGLDPKACLAHAIDQLARGHRATRLSELLPWNCKNALAAKTAQPQPSTVGISLRLPSEQPGKYRNRCGADAADQRRAIDASTPRRAP